MRGHRLASWHRDGEPCPICKLQTGDAIRALRVEMDRQISRATESEFAHTSADPAPLPPIPPVGPTLTIHVVSTGRTKRYTIPKHLRRRPGRQRPRRRL